MNVCSHLQGNFLAELCCSVLHCYCSRYRWASLAIRTLSQQIISNILELFGIIIIWNHQRQHRRALNFCISIWAANNAETKEATISHLQPSTLGEAWRKLQPTSWINAAQICNSGKIIMFLVIAIASSASLPSSAAVSTYPRLFSCSLRLLDVPPDWPQVLPTVLLRGRTLPFWKTVVEPTQTKQAARFQLSWECRHSSDTILGGVWCKVRGPQLFSQRLFCCRSGSPQ